MGFTHKSTVKTKDDIVQAIWLYQLLNDRATPSQQVIANELGITAPRVAYFINLLVDDNRVEKVQVRPMKLRIIPDPKNRKPCERAKRIFDEMTTQMVPAPTPVPVKEERAEALPPAEPAPLDNIIPEPEQFTSEVEPQQRLASAHRAFADELDPPPTEPRRTYVPQRDMNWREAEHIIAGHGGNLQNIASNYIIRTARDGDLVEELLDRGYTILKTNPSRR